METLTALFGDRMWSHYIDLALRLFIAVLIGATLGLDRENKDKPLGIRTYGLISLGACGFALLSLEISAISESTPGIGLVDPSRIVQGVIGGVGFLGAGAIFRSGDHVSGTATGAGIWSAGVIGLACGFGLYVLAVLVLLAAWLVFAALGTYLKVVASKIEDADD